METNLAVLIDFENIAAGTEKEGLGRFDVEALMQRVKDKGRILVARSYADWGRFSRFKQALLTANVTMMELTSHGMQDKNRADIAMVVDALELAFTKDYIDTFVVVSGDSDFTPMVLKMRELNKRVIGCGTRKSTSRLLIQACDEFFFYDTIAKPKQTRRRRARKPTSEGIMSLDTAYDLLEEALEGLQREDPDPPLASIVKTAMLRKSPDFSESDLNFPSFARFLEAAQEAGIVRIVRDRKSGGYRVDTLDEGGRPETAEAPAPSESWKDPYLPAGSETAVQALREAGFDPLGAPTRKAVLEAMEQAVAARRKRRRKVTIPFVTEDIVKELRRTHPEVPQRSIRSLLEALMQGGHLIHRDGTAIRSANATFKLDKDAEQLNTALTSFFLALLQEAGVDVSDSGMLSELFLGDSARKREIEETLAWLHAQSQGQGDEEELNAVDLDDLLVVDAEPAAKAPKAEAKPAEDKARAAEDKARAAEDKAKAAEEEKATEEAAAAEEAEAPKETKAKPKAKSTRKPRAKKAKAAEPAEAETEAKAEPEEGAAEEPKPKKKTTTRRKTRAKKKTDEESAESAESAEKASAASDEEPTPRSDLDALLEPG